MRIFFALILFLSLGCVSCRVNGVVPSSETVKFDVSAGVINSIDVETAIAVEFIQSDIVSVSVECPENLSDLLEVKIEDGKLEAGFKSGVSIDGNCNVVIKVSAPSLEEIDASSSASVEIAKGLKQHGPVDIEASSSARVVICGLDAAEVSAESSSSATIDLKGVKASELELDCSSSACIVAVDLACVTVDADASSAATIDLSGSAMYASYEASSAALINARGLVVEKLKKAKSSSAANISCSAKTSGQIIEESSGSVSVE